MAIDLEADPVIESDRHEEDDRGPDQGAAASRTSDGQADRFSALLADKEYVSDGLLRKLAAAGVVDVDSAVRILMVMHARNQHENWLSAPGMAARMGIKNARSVEKALARLVEEGFCWREGKPGQRRRRWRLGKKPADAYRRKKPDAQTGDSQLPELGESGSPKRVILNAPGGDPQMPQTGNPQSTVSRAKVGEHSGGGGEAATRTPTTTGNPSESAGNRSEEFASLGLDVPIDESSLVANGEPVNATVSTEDSPEVSAEAAGEAVRRGIRRIDPDAGFHQGSFDDRRRELAAEICRRSGISPSALEDIAAAYAARRCRAGGPPGQWKLDWFLDELPRLLADRLAPPAGPQAQSPARGPVGSGGCPPEDPPAAETGVQFLRRFIAISNAFFGGACAPGEGDARELKAAEEALSILTRSKCRNQMTIDAWIKWHLMAIKEEDAARYGVRVGRLVPTWEFARVRPRPENAIVPPGPVDEDCIWNILDGKVDVSDPNIEMVLLTSSMQYGVFIVGTFLAAQVGEVQAKDLIDRMIQRIQSDDPMWGKWLQKIYACTERFEIALGGYPAGAFMSDWRESLAATWKAAGCKPSKAPAEVSKQIVVFVRAFMKHIVPTDVAA